MVQSSSSGSILGDSDWYLHTLSEPCVQASLDAYLGDYSYLDGYTPSQLDTKVADAAARLDGAGLKFKPNLSRWFAHMKSFGKEERQALRQENHRIMSYCEVRMGKRRSDDCGGGDEFKVKAENYAL